MTEDKTIALEAYEALAENYAALIDSKPQNAYYERPAMLSLLPDVRGKRVLNAGCGPGTYTDVLVEGGAEVVGVDVSPKMIRLAKERFGDKAKFHIANLSDSITFLESESFDVVFWALALSYIRDQKPVFKEFYRLLKSPGFLVFSEGHPLSDYLLWKSWGNKTNYFETELVGSTWRGFGQPVYVPSYRRPLSVLLNALADGGFILDKIVEPFPTEEFRKADPKEYERLSKEPGFICIRARK